MGGRAEGWKIGWMGGRAKTALARSPSLLSSPPRSAPPPSSSSRSERVRQSDSASRSAQGVPTHTGATTSPPTLPHGTVGAGPRACPRPRKPLRPGRGRARGPAPTPTPTACLTLPPIPQLINSGTHPATRYSPQRSPKRPHRRLAGPPPSASPRPPHSLDPTRRAWGRGDRVDAWVEDWMDARR